MALRPAAAADLPRVAALVNSAYRGESSRAGWTTEADLLGGQRTDVTTLTADLERPGARLMVWEEGEDGDPLGCVWLERDGGGGLYLGMLTVSPDRQAAGLGRIMLAEAEALARSEGHRHIAMTVIDARHELVAWYERRGYRRTGEAKPFPYGDPRFGVPRRGDLQFIVLRKSLDD